MSEANASLRAQLVNMNVGCPFDQQDMSMRSPEDDNLRVKLAASLARESTLGTDLQITRFGVQNFVFELNAQRNSSANEICSYGIMGEEYLRSPSEFNEARSCSHASRERFESSEKQAGAWKDECRPIIVKGHEKEGRFEAELAQMRTEVTTMTQ